MPNIRSVLFTCTTNIDLGAIYSIIFKLSKYETESDFAYQALEKGYEFLTYSDEFFFTNLLV